MKKIYYVLSFLLLIPAMVSAHVKWFVDSEEVIRTSHGTNVFYSWQSKEVIIWSLIVLVTVFIFSLIDRRVKEPQKIVEFGMRNEKKINRISQVVLGLFLISVSFLWKIIIIPEIGVEGVFTMILQYVQVLIGLMFVFNLKPKLASMMLMIFCVGLIFSNGFVAFLENMILFTLALYFYIIHSKEDSWIYKKLNIHAVELVRIGTGVSLIVLAFTEKLLYPELSLSFLQVHQWNFMESIFPWFTDNLFVLSTGFAEMIFGILFIFGYITRITTILIALFFAMSVTTMLVQFGAWEVEDLVVYSAAILFLFFGHGKTKFFHLMWPNSKLQNSIIN